MPTYEYAVAKFIPDFVKDEPINIGVIVHEKDADVSHGKFIENFDYVKTRNPSANIKALQNIVQHYIGKQKITSPDYMSRLSNDCRYSIQFRVTCSKKADTIDQAVNELFEEYITVEPKQLVQ